MCTLSSIKLLVMVMSWFKLILTIYVFYVGVYFAGSSDLQQAFGIQFQSYGLSLIFLALLSGIIILPHKFGVDRHNRFIMVVTFVFDTIVFAELISFGLTVQSYTYPTFSKQLQLDCLRNTPRLHTVEECLPFYNSGRTAGFRLVWESYFTDKSDKSKFQVLSTIQGGLCCGFFPPYKCLANPDKFPKNRVTKGIDDEFLKARVTCGNFPNYYPEQSNCIDYEDFSANPPIIGGCYYDLGVSFCLNVDIVPSSTGCASATEDYLISLIAPHAIMLMACSTINAIFMLFACCMWWKRKETDIFPEFVTEHETSVQYEHVPDQFVVKPKRDLLRKEGFLPPLPTYDDTSQAEESKELDVGAQEKGDGDVEMNNRIPFADSNIEEAMEKVKHLQ